MQYFSRNCLQVALFFGARIQGVFCSYGLYRLIKHDWIALLVLSILLNGSFQSHRKAGGRESKVPKLKGEPLLGRLGRVECETIMLHLPIQATE